MAPWPETPCYSQYSLARTPLSLTQAQLQMPNSYRASRYDFYRVGALSAAGNLLPAESRETLIPASSLSQPSSSYWTFSPTRRGRSSDDLSILELSESSPRRDPSAVSYSGGSIQSRGTMHGN